MDRVYLKIPARFSEGIFSGKCRVVWFRGAKANIGDYFCIDYTSNSLGSVPLTYNITGVEPICLGVFCDNYWDDAGFDSERHARDYYVRLYGDPHEFYAIDGYLHWFEGGSY